MKAGETCGSRTALFVMLSVWTDVCIDVCTDEGFSSTSKGKPSLSNEDAMTDFRQTWYVGSGGGHKYYPHGLSTPNVHI